MSNETGNVPDFLKEQGEADQKDSLDNLPEDKLESLTLCLDRMVQLKEIHANNKAINAKVWSEFEKYQRKVMGLLKEVDLTSFEGKTHNVSINTRSSVKTPKTIEDKKKLFKWIEEHKGADVLYAYLSIASTSLNKFYETEKDLHFQETGETTFVLDGVEEPKSDTKLSLRKRKGAK